MLQGSLLWRRLLGAAGVATALAGWVAVSVAGCGTTLLNGLSSNAVYRSTLDIPYGTEARQTLDVYRPEGSDGPWPVLVFFYGGGWIEGSKGKYEFVASSFTREGYVVVVPDYRVWPDVAFPAFAEDAAEAVAWVQRNAPAHGGDPDRIVLMGHSAGAHLAALVTLDADLVRAAGGDPEGVSAFVGLSGPYDFLPLDEGSDLQEIFPPATRLASQPIHHVAGAERVPPVLLIHGTDDERVIPRNTRNLAEALRARGADVTVELYAGVGHARVAAALAPPITFVASTRGDVLAWLDGRVELER